jgi:hypothetical protein
VNFLALGQLAHPRDHVERALTVCIDQDNARALHGRSRHKHRKRDIDDRVPARA